MDKRFAVIAVLVLILPYVLGAPTGGTVSAGNSTRMPDVAAGTAISQAGNVSRANITGNTITTRWAGFLGEISGGILLGDSSNNVFYEWAVTDPTGAVIYAANATVSDWSAANVIAASASTMPAYLLTSANDNFTNTFSGSGDFNSSSLSIANVASTTTWQNGTQTANFTTYALQTLDNSTLIWAGSVQSDLTSFDVLTTDYQLLVPSTASGVTYNFYLEFR